jgi:hypothetical protein
MRVIADCTTSQLIRFASNLVGNHITGQKTWKLSVDLCQTQLSSNSCISENDLIGSMLDDIKMCCIAHGYILLYIRLCL